jgi:hypothetical protein
MSNNGDSRESSLCTLRQPSSISRPSQSLKQPQRQPKSPKEVEDWVRYIYGQGKKPAGNPTIISSSRPEKARNKPLVQGLIEDSPTKIFFDTGAELNIVDLAFVKELAKKDQNLKIDPSPSLIRCANDTKIKSIGKIRLRVTLNGTVMHQEFTVVEGFFPKVIVGIRQMKRYNIAVDPSQDCIWVGEVLIPFVSKIVPIQDQENERQLV